jgi:hypothetical protein
MPVGLPELAANPENRVPVILDFKYSRSAYKNCIKTRNKHKYSLHLADRVSYFWGINTLITELHNYFIVFKAFACANVAKY